jgi:hypothetical protein
MYLATYMYIKILSATKSLEVIINELLINQLEVIMIIKLRSVKSLAYSRRPIMW